MGDRRAPRPASAPGGRPTPNHAYSTSASIHAPGRLNLRFLEALVQFRRRASGEPSRCGGAASRRFGPTPPDAPAEDHAHRRDYREDGQTDRRGDRLADSADVDRPVVELRGVERRHGDDLERHAARHVRHVALDLGVERRDRDRRQDDLARPRRPDAIHERPLRRLVDRLIGERRDARRRSARRRSRSNSGRPDIPQAAGPETRIRYKNSWPTRTCRSVGLGLRRERAHAAEEVGRTARDRRVLDLQPKPVALPLPPSKPDDDRRNVERPGARATSRSRVRNTFSPETVRPTRPTLIGLNEVSTVQSRASSSVGNSSFGRWSRPPGRRAARSPAPPGTAPPRRRTAPGSLRPAAAPRRDDVKADRADGEETATTRRLERPGEKRRPHGATSPCGRGGDRRPGARREAARAGRRGSRRRPRPGGRRAIRRRRLEVGGPRPPRRRSCRP